MTPNHRISRPFMPESELWDLLEQGITHHSKPIQAQEALALSKRFKDTFRGMPSGEEYERLVQLEANFYKIFFTSVEGMPALPAKNADFLPVTDELSLRRYLDSFARGFARNIDRDEHGRWDCCGFGSAFVSALLNHYAGIDTQKVSVQVYYAGSWGNPDFEAAAGFETFVDVHRKITSRIPELSFDDIFDCFDYMESNLDVLAEVCDYYSNPDYEFAQDQVDFIVEEVKSAISAGLDPRIISDGRVQKKWGHVVCQAYLEDKPYIIDITKRQFNLDVPVVTVVKASEFVDQDGYIHLTRQPGKLKKAGELQLPDISILDYAHRKIIPLNI